MRTTTGWTAVLTTVVVVSGCSFGSDTASEKNVSPTVEPVPVAYRFVLESTCGERALIGDFRVEVRGGHVVSAENLNQRYGYEPRAPFDLVPTLEDLKRQAEEADDDTIVEYRTGRYGLPTRLELDPDPRGIDDEECYTVRDVEPAVE